MINVAILYHEHNEKNINEFDEEVNDENEI